MSDYISREELKLRIRNKIYDMPKNSDGTMNQADAMFTDGMYRALDLVEHMPSADVREIIKVEAEPNKGEWEFFDYPYMGYRCSKCGAIGNYDHKFCHDCGIEMKVESTEE